MMQQEGKTRKRTTLREIAGLAGVSVSTASLVLSGKGAALRISEEVGKRVRQVASENDYSPNLLVRSMQRGKTNILSFYSAFRNREPNDVYFDRLRGAIERTAGNQGYDLLTYCRASQSAEEVYQSLNGGQADGLLFFGPNEGDPLLALLRSSRLPTVILNHVDRVGSISYVTDDMENGMRLVANALLEKGHQRIAAIAGASRLGADSPLRVGLLQRYLAERGVTLPDRWIVPVSTESATSPRQALEFLLAEPNPPTALFCWHDRIGYRMLEVCEELGVVVPEQLSLIGYDGLHWPSTSAHRLASVTVDLERLAETSILFLDRLIQGEDAPLKEMFLGKFEPGTTLGTPSA